MNLKDRYFLASAVVAAFFILDISLFFYGQITVGSVGSYPFFQALLPVSIVFFTIIVTGLISIGVEIYVSKRHQVILEVTMVIYAIYAVLCVFFTMTTMNSGSKTLDLISAMVIFPKPVVVFALIPITEKYLLNEGTTQIFFKRITPFLVASGALLITRILLLQ